MKNTWQESIHRIVQYSNQLLTDNKIREDVESIDYVATFPISKIDHGELADKLR